MSKTPATITVLVFVFLFNHLTNLRADEKNTVSSEIKSEQEVSMPAGYEKVLTEETATQDRPYRELGIDTERAGFERYYYNGNGFELTNFFGVGASFEIYEEPKKIQDMTLIAGLEYPDYIGVDDNVLRQFLRPIFTRNIIAQGTLSYKKWPRFRYTYTSKDYILQFTQKDDYHWDQHNFDFLYSFKLFDRRDFLTLNPIYERRYVNKTNNDKSEDIENIYLVQYSVRPSDRFEFFGQLNWSRSESQTSEGKNKGFFFRLEPRFLIFDWKLRVTPGWYHGTSLYLPGEDEIEKNEIYLDLGKDITKKWRDGLRFEYIPAENDRSAPNPDVDVEVFNVSNKLSYEVLAGWDVSLGAVYGADMSDLDKFSNYGFFFETEFVRYGLFRCTASVQWNNYYDLDKDELMLSLRVHAFRF